MTRAIAILCLLATTAAAAVDLPRFLDATRAIENWHGRDGAAGELGPYQVRPSTWRQHMGTLPASYAREEQWGRECARRHVAWLQARLVAAGIDPNAFNLALAYNAGDGAVLRGRAPVIAYQHATRVQALYLATP